MALNILISAQNAASSVLGGLAGDLGKLNPAAIAAGAALAGIGMVLGESVKQAAAFQTGLTSLVTGAGEAESNLAIVGAGIKNISVQTGTSTDQLIKGMYMIESAGFHGADGLKVLQAAAEGAKVGNADLGTVANVVTTVLHDYGLSAGQANQVTSALITTVADGKTHLQDLATSMGNVLPLASALGISFPQVAGAIAAMTNAGMTAQRASMNLANAIRSLAAPGATAIKSMQQVGLSAQQLKNALSQQGLTGAIQLIEQHVGKTFPAGSVAAVEAFKKIMGGATGYNVALMLGGKNMAGYEANVQNITKALNAGAGSVAGWSLVQQDFNFKLDQARAAVSVLFINLGQALLPVLTKVLDAVLPLIQAFVNWTSQITTNQTAINVFVAILAGLGAVILVTVVPALAAMAAGVIAATWPFLLIGAAVTGAVILITNIFNGLPASSQQWGINMMVGFINGVESMIGDLMNILGQVAQQIANFLGFGSPTKMGPGKDLDKWGPNMVKGLAKGIRDSAGLVGSASEEVAKHLGKMHKHKDKEEDEREKHKDHAADAASALASGLTSGAGVVKAASTTLGSHLHTVCAHAHAASSCASTALTHHLASSIAAGHTHVKAAVLSLGQILTTTLAGQASGVQNATSQIAHYLQSIGFSAKTAAADASAAIKAGLTAGMAGGAKGVQTGTVAIEKYLMGLGISAQNAAKIASMAMTSGLAAQIQQNAGVLPPVVQKVIHTALSKALSAVKPAAAALGEAVAQPLSTSLHNVTQAAKPMLDTFDRAKSVLPAAGQAAKPLLDSFDRAKSVIPAVSKAAFQVNPVWASMGDLMSAIGSFLKTTFLPVWQQLVAVWNSQLLPSFKQLWAAIQPLLPVLGMLAQAIVGVLIIALGLLIAILAGLVKGLAGLISGVITIFAGIVQVITGAVQVISGIIQFIVDLFTGKFSKLGSDLGVIWQGIVNIFSGALQIIVGFFQAVWGTISGIVSGIVSTIIAFFTTLWNDLVGHSIIPDMINAIIYWFMMLPTAIGNAFSSLGTLIHSIWDGIALGVKAGINAIISVINGFIRFIDSIQIHIPSIGVGPFATPAFNWNGLGIPQIPYLATGGYVQASGLAMIHRGETVIPAGGARVAPLGSGGGNVIHHHYNVTVNALNRSYTPDELANQTLDAISRKLRSSGGLVTATSGGRAF